MADSLRIDIDVERARQNLVLLQGQITSLVSTMNAANSQVNNVRQNLGGVGQAASQATAGFGNFNSMLGMVRGGLIALGINATVQGMIQLGQSALDATSKFAQFNASQMSVTGSAKGAGEALAFVETTANKYGLSLEGLLTQYNRFSASAETANMSVEDQRKLFEDLSKAMRGVGVSGAQADRAFNAINQMMSKGKITSEELRQQFAEHLPGSMAIMAQAVGVSTAELEKMMKAGQVGTEVLPKFAELLAEKFGKNLEEAMKAPAAGLQILQNEFFKLLDIFGNSLWEGIRQSVTNLVEAMRTDAFKTWVADMGKVAAIVGTVLIEGFLSLSRVSQLIMQIFKDMGSLFVTVGTGIMSVVGPAFKFLGDVLSPIGSAAQSVLDFLDRFRTKVEPTATATATAATKVKEYSDELKAMMAIRSNEAENSRNAIASINEEIAKRQEAKKSINEEIDKLTALSAAKVEELNKMDSIASARDGSADALRREIAAIEAAKAALFGRKQALDDESAALGKKANNIHHGIVQEWNHIEALKAAEKASKDEATATGEAAKAKDDLAKKTDASKTALEQAGTATKDAGTAAGELSEEQKKANVALSDAQEKAKKLTEENKKLEEQNKTLGDKLNDMAGKLAGSNQALQNAVGSWQAFAKALVMISNSATNTSADLQRIATSLSTMPAALDKVTVSMPEFANQLNRIAEVLPPLAPAFTAMGLSVQQLATALPTFNSAVSVLSSMTPTLAEKMPLLAEAFKAFVEPATALSTTLPITAASFSSMNEAFLTLSNTMPVIVQSFEQLQGLDQRVQAIKDALAEFSTVVQGLQPVADAAGTAVDKMTTSLGNVVTNTDAAMASTDSFIGSMERATGVANDLADAYQKAADAAQELVDAQKELGGGSGGGGGGGTTTDAGSQGGVSGSMVQQVTSSAGAWSNAPALAQGIANTNSLLSKIKGGGIPTVLHPNEAVIPLSKGRKVPVDLSMDLAKSVEKQTPEAPKGFTDLAKAMTKIDIPAEIKVTAPEAMKPEEPIEISKNGGPTPVASDVTGVRERAISPKAAVPETEQTGNRKTPTPVVNITVNASDADSFKRSEDQIVRSLMEKLKRAERLNG